MDSNEAMLANISSSVESLSGRLDNVSLQVSSNTVLITNLTLQVDSHQDELLNLSARVDDNSRQGADNANSITNLTAQVDAVVAVSETHSLDIATLFDLLSALNSSLYELTGMFVAEPTQSVLTTSLPPTTLPPAATTSEIPTTSTTTTTSTTVGNVAAASTDDGFVNDTVIDSLTLVLLVLVVVLAVLVAILLMACAKQAQYLKKLRGDLKKIQKKLAPDEAVMLQLEKRVTDEIEQLRTSMRKASLPQPVGQAQQGFAGVDEQGATNGVIGNGQQAVRPQQMPPRAAHHVVPVDSRAVAREAAARQLEVALHGSLADSTAVRPSQPNPSSEGPNTRRLDPEALAAAEERAAAQQLRDSIKRSQQRQLQMLQRSIHRGRGR